MNQQISPLLAAATVPELSLTGRVIDVREASAYLEGHWPDAVHLDVRGWESLARSPEGSLRDHGVWEKQIGALGVNGAGRVLIYDDGRMTEAARVWFILQLYGVEAQVVDGGWRALLTLPGMLPDRRKIVPTPVPFHRPAGHIPRVELIERHDLRDRLLGEVQVVDARTEAEHVGADLRSNARGGHLPGAKSIPHATLLGADGRLRSGDALQTEFLNANVDPNLPVVTHCDAGGRAALAALAAVVAGHRDVSAYYLSFSDWAADGSCPIVHP